MRKFTLVALTLSGLLAGCTYGKFQDSPSKEIVLDGFPMMLRVVHEGPEFEILATRNEGFYFPDVLRDKRLAITVTDSEAVTICGPNKPHLITREKAEATPFWLSRYRCD